MRSFGLETVGVAQDTDARSNSEDSVVCHSVCPLGLFVGGLEQEDCTKN